MTTAIHLRQLLSKAEHAKGFTLIELLVVVSIIGVLTGLLLPAIQAAREAARRTDCMNRLKQHATAIQNYHSQHDEFPTGGAMHQIAGQTGISWRVLILPFIEQQPLFDKIAPHSSGGANNWDPQGEMPDLFRCPSVDSTVSGANTLQESNYWGVAGTARQDGLGLGLNSPTCGDLHRNGVFFPASETRIADITDGTSHTLAIGERTYLFRAWMTGSTWVGNPLTRVCAEAANHVSYPINASHEHFGYYVGDNLRPAGTPATIPLNDLWFGSLHPGGVHFAFADSSVHFFPEQLDITLFQDLVTIAGDEVNRWEP